MYRLYCQFGLNNLRTQAATSVQGGCAIARVGPLPTAPNQARSMDFVADVLSDGRDPTMLEPSRVGRLQFNDKRLPIRSALAMIVSVWALAGSSGSDAPSTTYTPDNPATSPSMVHSCGAGRSRMGNVQA